MKCIQWKLRGKIERVSNDEANRLIRASVVNYVPRHVWKKEVRDAETDGE